MNRKWIIFAGTCIALVAVERVVEKPVLAQVRAALVKNIDEKGRNPFQVVVPCTVGADGPGYCSAILPAVPAGKRLVLEYVNAFTSSGTTAPQVVLGSGLDILGVLPTFPSRELFGVSSPVLLYVEQGHTATLQVNGGTSGSVTFTGYLVDLTE